MTFEQAITRYGELAEQGIVDRQIVEIIMAQYSAERRDRIATAALNGLLASDSGERSMNRQSWWSHSPREAAECAVELADALIAELDKPRSP